jgi:hypothetical protein
MGPESRVGRDIPDTIRLRSDLEDTAGRYQTNRGCGADDETRTRDIDLGKVALYQLSYIRMPGTGTGIVTGRSRLTSCGTRGTSR